jgi:hypothetical protein
VSKLMSMSGLVFITLQLMFYHPQTV